MTHTWFLESDFVCDHIVSHTFSGIVIIRGCPRKAYVFCFSFLRYIFSFVTYRLHSNSKFIIIVNRYPSIPGWRSLQMSSTSPCPELPPSNWLLRWLKHHRSIFSGVVPHFAQFLLVAILWSYMAICLVVVWQRNLISDILLLQILLGHLVLE